MPQMAPISWLMLFIMFSASLMMFNTMNYYSFYNTPPKTSKMPTSSVSTMNWKW